MSGDTAYLPRCCGVLTFKGKIMSKATNAFKAALTRKGLLGRESGIAIVHGVEGEDALLAKWRAVADKFVHRGHHVRVDMGVERLYFGESRVWPIVTLS